MAMPVSARNIVEQYAGRLNRDFGGKPNVIVYEYVDSHIPMFDNMYAKRLKAYKKIGYEVCTGIVGEKQTTIMKHLNRMWNIPETKRFTKQQARTVIEKMRDEELIILEGKGPASRYVRNSESSDN